jgi:hypothetical protein
MDFKNESLVAERDTDTTPAPPRADSTTSQHRRKPRPKTNKFTWPELPAALHESQPWGKAGVEPPLNELLADPVVRAIMQRDGVTTAALTTIIASAVSRMRRD